MYLESSKFESHHEIPTKYSCEGEDISPPLTFGDIPPGAKSLALILEDPDAPRGTFIHWIAWNLPIEELVIKEGSKPKHQGKNHFGKIGYGGPCPPPGKSHRYFFKLFALDTFINLSEGSTKEQLEDAMEGHVLGRAELIGTYKRKSS